MMYFFKKINTWFFKEKVLPKVGEIWILQLYNNPTFGKVKITGIQKNKIFYSYLYHDGSLIESLSCDLEERDFLSIFRKVE